MDNMDGIPPWWLDWSFYPSVLLVWLWSVALPGNDDNDYEIIMEDFLLVILTVPLVDKSLQMDLYKVHNLPTQHPKLNIQFTYQLEGKCLAIGKHGLYAALPSENDIRICMTTSGGLCMIESSPVSHRKNRMVYLCLIHKRFSSNSKVLPLVETKVRHANLAVSLEGYMWAISSMVTTKVQIRCLTVTYLEK